MVIKWGVCAKFSESNRATLEQSSKMGETTPLAKKKRYAPFCSPGQGEQKGAYRKGEVCEYLC